MPSPIAIGASDSVIQTYAFMLLQLRLSLEESAKMSGGTPPRTPPVVLRPASVGHAQDGAAGAARRIRTL